jgi:hypothetical protein
VERLHATRDSAAHAGGAQPWYDHAIASVAVRLFDAAPPHAQAAAGTDEDRT